MPYGRTIVSLLTGSSSSDFYQDIVVQEGAIPFGIYPAVLGHEGAGTVRRVGSNVQDKSLKEGDTVLLSFSSCQNCSTCKENRNGACSQMTNINFGGARGLEPSTSPISLPDGTPVRGQFFGQSSLSKLAVVSERSIVKCDASPEDLAFLAPLGCGYLTGAGTVFNVLRPKKDSKFVVFGMVWALWDWLLVSPRKRRVLKTSLR